MQRALYIPTKRQPHDARMQETAKGEGGRNRKLLVELNPNVNPNPNPLKP